MIILRFLRKILKKKPSNTIQNFKKSLSSIIVSKINIINTLVYKNFDKTNKINQNLNKVTNKYYKNKNYYVNNYLNLKSKNKSPF